MKQDFLVTSFWLPTLLTVKCSSRYFILYMVFDNCFWIDWVHVYKYTKIKGLNSSMREITSLPGSKKSDEHGMSFRSSLKIKIVQWKFTTPDQLARPSAPLIKVLLITIVLFLDHFFQSNQHFQAIEFVDQPIPEKL